MAGGSDTSLIFQFIPVDRGVGAMMRRVAADTAVLTAANKTSGDTMARTSGEADKMGAAVRRLGDSSEIHGKRITREFFKIDNSIANTGRRWLGIGAIVGGVVLALLGHVVAFTQAVWQVVGALAAVPAVAFGAGVGLGSLLLIFKNLLPAMKSAGSGGANAADQIAQATHRYEQAQRSAAQAQKDLNDARAEATRNLQDMNRELAKAALDERAAVLSVKEAEQNLRQVRASGGSRNDREAAQIAYEQAVISLSEIREKNADLQAQETDRAAKGVEGSDEVQAALQRQADALYELQQAQQAVAQAQTGSGGTDAAAQAYAKLSDAGKQLVGTLKSLAPGWSTLQRAIQQAGLENVAIEVQGVSNVLLDQQGYLVAIAAAWNTVFVSSLRFLQTPEAVAGLNRALGNTVSMSQNMAGAWVPFLHGFLQFVTVGSDFLPRLGAWVTDLAIRFDNWATAAANTGRMHDWIENAVTAATNLGHIIGDVAGGIGAIFNAGSGGPNYLAKLADDAQRWHDLMASPEMQTQLAKFFESTRELGSSLWVVITALTDAITKVPGVVKEAAGALNLIGIALKFAADHADLLNKILPPLITLFLIYKTTTMAIRLGLMLWTAATKAYTVAQWLLNVAMDANPIGLLIIGIAALIAGIILLWTHSEAFRNFFIGLWGHIWDFLKGIGAWFAGPFVDFFVNAWHWIVGKFEDGVAWVKGWIDRFLAPIMAIKDHIQQVGIWQTLQDGFKAAVNFIIGLWNKLDFSLGPWQIPDWVPFVGGKQFYIPDIFPDIPFLASGGRVVQEGMAYIHRGEEVVPAAQVERGGGGAGPMVLEFHSDGTRAGDLLVELMRHAVRVRGGNVQVALGR